MKGSLELVEYEDDGTNCSFDSVVCLVTTGCLGTKVLVYRRVGALNGVTGYVRRQ